MSTPYVPDATVFHTTIDLIDDGDPVDMGDSNPRVRQVADNVANVDARIKYREDIFNADGTWTCPVGCEFVELDMFGAGGGGSNGGTGTTSTTIKNPSGAGGAGAISLRRTVKTTAGLIYSISIGIGGDPGVTGLDANDGGATVFQQASVPMVVQAMGGQGASGNGGAIETFGSGLSLHVPGGNGPATGDPKSPPYLSSGQSPLTQGGVQAGGYGGGSTTSPGAFPTAGRCSLEGSAGGNAGTQGATAGHPGGSGGGGGGGGPEGGGGAGGTGGAGNDAGIGVAGGNAPAIPVANSGAGGGGGGAAGNGTTGSPLGGTGRKGSNGKCYVRYFGPQAIKTGG